MDVLGDYLQPVMAVSIALPSLMMSARLFRVWRNPMSVDDGAWVNRGLGVFLMEFILLISGLYIGTKMAETENTADRILTFAGILMVYGIFAAGIAKAYKSLELFLTFLWLMSGRLIAIVLGASKEESHLIVAYSVVGLAVYMLLILFSKWVQIPKLGITDELAERLKMPGARGLWVEQPSQPIGIAAIYFLLFGIIALAVLSWIDPSIFNLERFRRQ